MNYNKKKHYYDPYDSLDVEWKAKITRNMLSVGEAASLSGFSRQYINRLVTNGTINAKKNKEGYNAVLWKDFVKWFSALPVTPHSPIGYASFSLKELMRYTSMGRCWVLKLVKKHGNTSL